MKKVVIGIVIVVAVVMVVGFVPLMDVPYQDTETYYVDEPYEVTETYTKAVPLSFETNDYVKADTIKEHHQIIIGGIVFQDEIVEVPIQVACVEVENTDEVAGNFTVSFSGFEPMFGEYSLTTILSLGIGEQKTAECPAESIDNWSYEVTPSTKEVEAERTVTKYRQVERERTVTRYKKGSIFEYLVSRF